MIIYINQFIEAVYRQDIQATINPNVQIPSSNKYPMTQCPMYKGNLLSLEFGILFDI
jgi:hypothetical protein